MKLWLSFYEKRKWFLMLLKQRIDVINAGGIIDWMFLPGITAWCMDIKPAAMEKKIRILMRTPPPRELLI